jgi:hypothetical protein
MKRRAVIRFVRRAARCRELVFTAHALDEMDADGETRETVATVPGHGRSWTLQDNGRWLIRGEGLSVVVEIHEQTVVVWTVFAC